jgi:predicted transcriptional regulator
MKAITIRSIKSQGNSKTKALFWHLFVGTRGGNNRVRIINQLRNRPSNKNQISNDLKIEYKLVEHHIYTLEKSNLVTKFGSKYGATYIPSSLFEESENVFDEIVEQLKKVGGDQWLI